MSDEKMIGLCEVEDFQDNAAVSGNNVFNGMIEVMNLMDLARRHVNTDPSKVQRWITDAMEIQEKTIALHEEELPSEVKRQSRPGLLDTVTHPQ